MSQMFSFTGATLEVTPVAIGLEDAIKDGMFISNLLSISVNFDFNGSKVEINPGSTFNEVWMGWQNDRTIRPDLSDEQHIADLNEFMELKKRKALQ